MFARRPEGKRERIPRELLPVYLALKYTVVHVFGRVRGQETGTVHPGIVSKFKLHSAKRKSPGLGFDLHSRNANVSRSRREILQLHENPRVAGADVNILGVFEAAHSRLSPFGILYKGMNSARRTTNAPLQNDPLGQTCIMMRATERFSAFRLLCTQRRIVLLTRVSCGECQRVYFLTEVLSTKLTLLL